MLRGAVAGTTRFGQSNRCGRTRLLEVSGIHQRAREVRLQQQPVHVVGWQQIDRSREQRHGAGRVMASERAVSRHLQHGGGPSPERNVRRVAGTKLHAQSVCLLEVIPEDLVVRARPLRRQAVDPSRECLVQLGSILRILVELAAAEPSEQGASRLGLLLLRALYRDGLGHLPHLRRSRPNIGT